MKVTFLSFAIDSAKSAGLTVLGLILFAIIAGLTFALSPALRQRVSFSTTALSYPFPRRMFSSTSSKIDLVLFVLRFLVYRPLIGLLGGLGAGIALNGVLVSYFGRRSAIFDHSWANLVFQVVATTLAAELSVYVYHRWSHTNRFIWTAHRLHHSAETLTFLTSGRIHPLEVVGDICSKIVIAGPINALTFYLSGAQVHPLLPTALLVYGIWASLQDKFNHSHFPISFGPLNWIFQSGHMHQIHHSAELRHRDKNFAATLSLFDWLFGTIYIPQPDEVFRLGLTEEELGDYNPHRTVSDALLEPFRYLKQQLTKSRLGALHASGESG
jgi:sterol desaturase/sphingolipid hydroxylase (fatty acid hydroxylase superfamily)